MARHYPLNYSTFGADMQAALEDFYGSGVTIHKVEERSITFSCPKIFDRPMKIAAYQPAESYPVVGISCVVYPDETLSSGVTVSSTSPYTQGARYGINMVLSKKFMLIQTEHSETRYVHTVLAARATNGRSFVVCGHNLDNSNNARCLFADKMQLTQIQFNMQSTGNAFYVGKKLLLKPVFFGENYELELNEDGTLASIDGLYSCGKYVVSQPIVGENYFMSVSGIRGNSAYGVYAPGTFYISLESNGDGGDVAIPATRRSSSFISYIELLAANWVGTESPYSQVVTIPGVTENCKVEPDLSVEQIEAFRDKELAFSTENEDGVVTVYAIGQKPENDYTIQVTITEVDV